MDRGAPRLVNGLRAEAPRTPGGLLAAEREPAVQLLARAFRDNPLNVAVIGSDDPARRLRGRPMTTNLLDCFQERARRMGQMMHRLQVDVVGLACSRHGGDFAKVRATCAACSNAERCDRAHEVWLAGGASDSPDEYCPNAALLGQFRDRHV